MRPAQILPCPVQRLTLLVQVGPAVIHSFDPLRLCGLLPLKQAAGVAFIPKNGGGPGVRLHEPQQTKSNVASGLVSVKLLDRSYSGAYRQQFCHTILMVNATVQYLLFLTTLYFFFGKFLMFSLDVI